MDNAGTKSARNDDRKDDNRPKDGAQRRLDRALDQGLEDFISGVGSGQCDATTGLEAGSQDLPQAPGIKLPLRSTGDATARERKLRAAQRFLITIKINRSVTLRKVKLIVAWRRKDCSYFLKQMTL